MTVNKISLKFFVFKGLMLNPERLYMSLIDLSENTESLKCLLLQFWKTHEGMFPLYTNDLFTMSK